MIRAPIEAAGEGSYRLRIGRRERAVLRSLPGQLERMLAEAPGDPALRRLFPPAYDKIEDAEGEEEYRRLVVDDLLTTRRERLQTFARSLDKDHLTEADLEAWLTALNDLRLVLGTRLEVTEEDLAEPLAPRDPRAEERALYGYLSWLQEHVVAVLSP